MIPLPANVKLIVGIIVVGGIGALNAIAHVEPTWAWVGTGVSVLTAVELFFTIPNSAVKKPAA
jgi:hypothetical protein